MNQKHLLQGMVVFVAGLMALSAWADPPGREGTSSSPPVMQEPARMTESPPGGRGQVARDLLTPEQQVKFLMYSVKFHKEMRERLERERGGRQPQSGQEQEKP